MQDTPYLTKEQLVRKHPFITKNMLKNILHKNINSFRESCVKKLGKKILINEKKFLKYISEQPSK